MRKLPLGASGMWCSEVSSHRWPVTTGIRHLSSPSSVACQEPYRRRSLWEGLELTVLSLLRNRDTKKS